MAATQAVWGIDIGRCALRAVKLRPATEGQVEVVAHEFHEHAKILSQPDADRHELIAAALEKFLSHNDLTKDQVVVSVPGQNTLSRFTKLPPVAPKRIPDIVRYEAEQQIPFDMDEVIWDYQTFQKEGLPDIEVGIFAMKRELIREHLLHFEQAGIEPIAVQSGPLAVYNAAEADGFLAADTTILLDIGAENTDLIVATSDGLWTRTVPIGGNSFTEALVKSFKLSFAKAETLKRTATESKYARQIFQAMRPIFADLVQELQRSIGFYSSTHRDAKVEKVVGVGNAFLLPGLQKYLQQNLGLPVECPSAYKKIVPSAVSGQPAFKDNVLSYCAAYGLALQGLDLGKVTTNLLPTEIAKQVVWRKKRPAFAAAAACLVLAGGLVWFRQVTDMRALASGGQSGSAAVSEAQSVSVIENGPQSGLSERGKAQAILAAGNNLKKQLGALQGKGAKERTETEKLIDLQKNKTIVPRILQIVHESVPVPEGKLGEAATPADVLKAVQEGATPRAQRNQVHIEIFDMLYEPDLLLYNWSSVIDVPPPLNDYETAKNLAGFILKITCLTPNEGGQVFMRDAFLAPLREKGRQPGLGFYLDQVVLHDGTRLDGGASGAATRPISTGRGGRGAGSKPAGSSPTTRTEHVDPITLEPLESEWQFEVWVSVVLGDAPDPEAPKPAGQPPKQGTKPPGKGP